MNWFFEKENTGDRGREWGFAQSATLPILLEKERLKVGVEMEYKNFTVKDTRGDPMHSFVIGPTLSYRTSHSTRFDVSTLFGCTADAPAVQVFAVFSFYSVPELSKAQKLLSRRVIASPYFSNSKINKNHETTRLSLKYLLRLW